MAVPKKDVLRPICGMWFQFVGVSYILSKEDFKCYNFSNNLIPYPKYLKVSSLKEVTPIKRLYIWREKNAG